MGGDLEKKLLEGKNAEVDPLIYARPGRWSSALLLRQPSLRWAFRYRGAGVFLLAETPGPSKGTCAGGLPDPHATH